MSLIPSGPPKDDPKKVEALKQEAEHEVLIRLTVLSPMQVFRFLCAIRRARSVRELDNIIAEIKKFPVPSASPVPAPEPDPKQKPDEEPSERPDL